jgi:DNA-binding NtrC family response regulator
MAAKPKILIADDQPDVQRAISFICTAEGYHPITASSPAAALRQLTESNFDLLLMDMNYRADHTSGEEGLRLIQEVRQLRPDLPVVVMTAWGSIALAVEALKLGAKDFLQKPWDNERLIQILRTQLELRSALQGKAKLEAENRAWRDAAKTQPEPLVSQSPAMREVYRMVEQVAPADANVLITGENGTGKNVVARLIHERSTRSTRPLISVNMGGIPENLFESEMFGHVKGAFTDARADRVGRFELADGGSLFLDVIGNLTSA